MTIARNGATATYPAECFSHRGKLDPFELPRPLKHDPYALANFKESSGHVSGRLGSIIEHEDSFVLVTLIDGIATAGLNRGRP